MKAVAQIVLLLFVMFSASGCMSRGVLHSAGRQQGRITSFKNAYQDRDRIILVYTTNVGGKPNQLHWASFPVSDANYSDDFSPNYSVHRYSPSAFITNHAKRVEISWNERAPCDDFYLHIDPDDPEKCVRVAAPDVEYTAWWGYPVKAILLPVAMVVDTATLPLQLYIWHLLLQIDK